MVRSISDITGLAAGAIALCSIGYYLLCLYSAARFLRGRKAAGEGGRPTPSTQPVSILKPLRGTDPEMYESFRSHCVQDHLAYEIIFGVSDPADPAIELVERLKKEFPQSAIYLKICSQNLGSNTKVSNLAQMLPQAKYENILVNDSDIRVEPDYLRRVIAPLQDDPIGLITCLYRGIASPTLGSRLEAIGISTDFAAGVLTAQQLEGAIRFGLGATLAFRRRDLETIGGFEAIVDYLADDYEIGKRIAQRGLKVKLSEVVVETFLPAYTLRQFLDHQLRWARAVRDSRRGGYLGLVLTFGLPWAVIALVLTRGALWSWIVLAAVTCLRVGVAWIVAWSVLRDLQVLRLLPLLPLRDFSALLIWFASLFGHEVVWRGDVFELKDGKLVRLEAAKRGL